MDDRLRVLLIGGSGFLGHHAAAALAAAGHEVTVMSRGNATPPPGARTLRADRGDRAALGRALEGQRFDLTVDFLVYDAADVETLLLVPYAALGRYVMISTGQVYLVTQGARPPYREDDADAGPTAEPPPGTLDHDQWSYGVGKRRAERRLLGLRGSHGVRATILRLPILHGRGDGSRRLWAYLERMKDGGVMVLPEAGEMSVRFLWAGDVGRVVVRLASESPQAAVYNLAQPDTPSLRAFLEATARIARLPLRWIRASWEECEAAGLDRTFSPFASRWRSIMDPTRAATEWSFTATPSEDYLPEVVRWHLEHPGPSHPGYALRALELQLAATRGSAAQPAT